MFWIGMMCGGIAAFVGNTIYENGIKNGWDKDEVESTSSEYEMSDESESREEISVLTTQTNPLYTEWLTAAESAPKKIALLDFVLENLDKRGYIKMQQKEIARLSGVSTPYITIVFRELREIGAMVSKKPGVVVVSKDFIEAAKNRYF